MLFTLMNYGSSQQPDIIIVALFKAKRLYRECSRNSRSRTSLIAVKRGKQMLVPFLFEDSTTQFGSTNDLKIIFLRNRGQDRQLIMGNAAFYNKKVVSEIARKYGYYALFFPPYLPDFNPIEQDFANIKNIRVFDNKKFTPDDIM